MNWLRRFTWSEDWSFGSEPAPPVVVQHDDSLISILAAKDRKLLGSSRRHGPAFPRCFPSLEKWVGWMCSDVLAAVALRCSTREQAQGRDPARHVVFHLEEEEPPTDEPALERVALPLCPLLIVPVPVPVVRSPLVVAWLGSDAR
jgi:hypothetical protein